MGSQVRRGLRIALFALTLPALSAGAAVLRGSEASMIHQHAVAVEEKYSFLRTSADVQHLVKLGLLVAVTSGSDFVLSGVSFP